MKLDTAIFGLIITALFTGIGWLVKTIVNRNKSNAETDKEKAIAENTKALTEKTKMETNEYLRLRLEKEIEQLIEDRKANQEAKIELIKINKELINANELLRQEIQELRKEVEELRLQLVKAGLNIVNTKRRTRKNIVNPQNEIKS